MIHGNTGNTNAVKIEDKADDNLRIRCKSEDKDIWKLAFQAAQEKDLTKWIIKTLNKAAAKALK